MPCPQYSRTTEKRCSSTKLWIAWPMSPSRAPGRIARMPRHIASKHTFVSRSAMIDGAPTMNMRLVSPW